MDQNAEFDTELELYPDQLWGSTSGSVCSARSRGGIR